MSIYVHAHMFCGHPQDESINATLCNVNTH